MNTINKVIETLNKKQFKADIAANANEAITKVLSIINENESIGVGGSMTLEETGILDALIDRGNKVYSSSIAKKTGGDPDQAKIDGMTADVYLTSTNALTMAGDLINIDGTGNRVAGMIYGPSKIVVVTGKNKITENPHTAIARIKKVACPPNARRLGRKTPCALTGNCGECSGPERMCNVVVRMQYPTTGKEIYIIVIDDDFGY